MRCEKCGREEFEDQNKLFNNVHKVLTVITLVAGLYHAYKSFKVKSQVVINVSSRDEMREAVDIAKNNPDKIIEVVLDHIKKRGSALDIANQLI